MKRTVAVALDDWIRAPDRKPLVLRGARQVGKTWLVRDAAAILGEPSLALDFARGQSWARAVRL